MSYGKTLVIVFVPFFFSFPDKIQEARAAGCRTSAEADTYLEKKRKREAEENAHRAKDSAQAGQNNAMAADIGKDSSGRLHGEELLSEAVSSLFLSLRLFNQL